MAPHNRRSEADSHLGARVRLDGATHIFRPHSRRFEAPSYRRSLSSLVFVFFRLLLKIGQEEKLFPVLPFSKGD